MDKGKQEKEFKPNWTRWMFENLNVSRISPSRRTLIKYNVPISLWLAENNQEMNRTFVLFIIWTGLNNRGGEKGRLQKKTGKPKKENCYLLCVHIHLFSSNWERSVIVKTYQLSFCVFICAFYPKISSFFH